MKKARNRKSKFFQLFLDKTKKALYNNTINKRIKRRKIMANRNYTDEMVAKMVATYNDNPNMDTVKELARELGKTTRSIIAKLSREGVYKAQPRTTKTGEPVVQKKELVAEVATILGVDESQVASLVKATKTDLKNLVERLAQVC